MDFSFALELLKQLEAHLKKYGNDSIVFQYKTIESTISFLEADNTDEEKEDCIIQSYKLLYPVRGGLSEFYIWKNNFELRKELNAPLERIHNELWEIVKDRL